MIFPSMSAPMTSWPHSVKAAAVARPMWPVPTMVIRVIEAGIRVMCLRARGPGINCTTWSTFNVNLTDGQNLTQPYSLRINYLGLWKIQFLLFKEGDFWSAYREIHLFVRVQSSTRRPPNFSHPFWHDMVPR